MLYTQWGVWGFNPNYILGGYLYNLPFEEVLFFVCIPFSCVFTYHCLNIFYKFTWRPRTEQWVVIGLCSILLALGVYSFPKLYTSATFISLSFFLLFLKFKAKVNWLPKLVLIYPVLLIPFFIVNGILTGTGIDSPVVWYNDHENMGLRLFTIPIEDIFYGFELILLNIYIYEYLKGEEGGS
jgi:lycopene cyclase domain-containing protein